MTARRDLTNVRPLGSYAAKQCPVRLQLDVLRPADPRPPSPELQRLFEDGSKFEIEVTKQLEVVAEDDWVFVDEQSTGAVDETLRVMNDRASVIVGSNLPPDNAGKRSGKPDLLVHDGYGYVPVDIKNHRALDQGTKRPALTSALESPFPHRASTKDGVLLRRRKEDALQLAHYRRMLEAMGLASREAVGGIIGTELEVAWHRLDVPMWQTPAKSDGKKVKLRTTLENYDFEFGFRLDVASVAHAHIADPDRELLVLPVRCSECPECPWRDHCDTPLTAGTGDPSLLPRVGYRQWRALRDAGIFDRAGVAELDEPTARLGALGVDVETVLERVAGADGTQPLSF